MFRISRLLLTWRELYVRGNEEGLEIYYSAQRTEEILMTYRALLEGMSIQNNEFIAAMLSTNKLLTRSTG